MNSFQITDVKKFMSAMLLHDTFDGFTLSEATVKTAVSFVIDGKINPDFYDNESSLPEEPFVQYGQVRGFFYEIIKGKRTPVYFKFVFHAPGELIEKLLSESDTGFTPKDINSLTLTATFKDGALTVLTGTNLATFSLDKTIDQAWDRYVAGFLEQLYSN